MSSLAFQMPEKIFVEKVDPVRGIFSFRPLEKGYGTTIGNTLRRVLLSSLEGYAIVSIKIPGIRHEFSTIEGVQEDLVEIILNLKQVRLKKIAEGGDAVVSVRVNKSEFRAGDIAKATPFFEVLNPDLLICRLDASASFDIELHIVKHRGYLSAEDNKPKDPVLGLISIDAIFSPIVSVQYRVENMRVEQRTDYEQLTFEVKTDGSISPEESIRQAAKLMIQHLNLLSGQEIVPQSPDDEIVQILDEETVAMQRNLKTHITELKCSSRVLNCLKSAGIETLEDLVTVKDFDNMKFRNFGRKSRDEIDQLLAEKNLKIGMDLSGYKLDG
ncbi:MAG: DNA-directed RNA polymerase subunit alpha [Candidatus Cardinium sp.]|uniref:DNA-directed RNA polymerase subunit alpha n=1 Tax=Cardinium endosymbiont of Dermatophagoides farinae TaxID=2597823 RepID=UPI00118402FE|nr:DNA-directed RNA polymerase subunit alpha [Cardinium endosymbiont of Dermatophagoides farinae]TSJ81188.1 DNA-directed RNA polymerase subunit alpha [Cardinium endosymbiont of Dermatophagoides farinae]UWW97235.1 MAG: DNA-directed RNA polymerase subunit alpha [Candidatus Cardinium sp.]